MKLLLDEMWSPGIAVQLRRRGHDVIAVAERADLRRRSDRQVFDAAQIEERAILTENVGDFRRIVSQGLAADSLHRGLVFTTNQSFPRHGQRTIGRLVTALHDLLAEDTDLTGRELWLSGRDSTT